MAFTTQTGIAVDIDQIVASFFGERIQIIIGIGISPVRLFSRPGSSPPADETVIIPSAAHHGSSCCVLSARSVPHPINPRQNISTQVTATIAFPS